MSVITLSYHPSDGVAAQDLVQGLGVNLSSIGHRNKLYTPRALRLSKGWARWDAHLVIETGCGGAAYGHAAIEIRQTILYRSIRADSISINSTLPPLNAASYATAIFVFDVCVLEIPICS